MIGRMLGGAALAALALSNPVRAQSLAYSGSLQYATGDYIFSERTNSVYLSSGLDAELGRLRLSGSVPLIWQSTPWISYTGGGGVPSGGPQHGDVGERTGGMGRMGRGGDIVLEDTSGFTEVGFGDPLARAELQLVDEADALPRLGLAAEVKFPLADPDRGFGTGEWDYAAGVTLSKSFGTTFLFGDLSYWVLGDLPDLELQNPVAYSLSLGRPLSPTLAAMVSVSGYSQIVEGTDPPAQIGLGLSYRIDGRRSLSGLAAFGLTESSSDVSLSFGWRMGL